VNEADTVLRRITNEKHSDDKNYMIRNDSKAEIYELFNSLTNQQLATIFLSYSSKIPNNIDQLSSLTSHGKHIAILHSY